MFGWFKRELAPDGPVEIVHDVEIHASYDNIFALIDFGDPRNAKVALGHRLRRIGPDGRRYRLHMTGMPETLFKITVLETAAGAAYAYHCDIVPRIGRLLSTRESYSIVPTEAGSFRVTLTVLAQFIDSMRVRTLKKERELMSRATRSSLAKLQVHAERGIEAARAVEHHFV